MNQESSMNKSPEEFGEISPAMFWIGKVLSLIVIAALLAAGIFIAVYFLKNRPTAERRRPPARSTLVEVSPILRTDEVARIGVLGTVVPARSVQLSAQVGGNIIEVHPAFKEGGYFKKGEQILKIDPRDYQLALQNQKSALDKAQSDLRVEMGEQAIAQREYELLGRNVSAEEKELLLRKPQLDIAQAAVDSAKAALEQAEINLARTSVIAPFNATVQKTYVEIGSQLSPGASLATLAGSDTYWVEVAVPMDQLQWIRFPNPREADGSEGSSARVYYETAWDRDASREGLVVRLLSELEEQGRMARLLVAVDDPLELKRESKTPPHPLLLGSYVRVEIIGREIPNVIRLSREQLHNGSEVWLMNDEKKLDIRPVEIAWGSVDEVFIREGLEEGEKLIVSDLSAPVAGMSLRLPGENGNGGPGGPQGKGGKPSAEGERSSEE